MGGPPLCLDASASAFIDEALSKSPRAKTPVDPYLKMAMYNAFANMVLILFGVILFGLYLLLRDFIQPLLWAGLCAVLLKGYKDSLVEFWVPFLEHGLSSVLAVPFLLLRDLFLNVGIDTWGAVSHLVRPLLKKDEPKEKDSAPKLKRRRSGPASMMKQVKQHTKSEVLFEWLAAFGVCSLAWSWLRLRHGLVLSACGLACWAAAETLKERLRGRWSVGTEAAETQDSVWQRLAARVKSFDRSLGKSVLSSLHTLVTVGLVMGLLLGALALMAFFSYAIVMETKTGVEGLNARVQQHGSKFADSMGVTKWLQENDVPALVNSTYERALGTAREQFDDLVIRYNLTEVVETVRDSLEVYFAEHNPSPGNGTVATIRPASEVAARVKGIKTSLVNYQRRSWKQAPLVVQFQDALGEIQALIALSLTKLPVSTEQLREYLRIAQTTGTAALKVIVAQGSTMLTGGATLVVTSCRMVLSGAMGFVQFTLQAGFFLTLLYALLSAEEGAVSGQLLGLLPVSEKQKAKISDALFTAISGVLLCSVKLALFQTAFTCLLFRAFRIHFLYTCTMLAGLNAVLPLIPNWLSSLPAGLQLAASGNYVGGILLVVGHNLMLGQGSDVIYGDIPGSQPYLTGLSVVGGMSVFQSPIQGAIFGPLIVTIVVALRNLYSEFVGHLGSGT